MRAIEQNRKLKCLEKIIEKHKNDPLRGEVIDLDEIKFKMDKRLNENIKKRRISATLKKYNFQKWSSSDDNQNYLVHSGEIEY